MKLTSAALLALSGLAVAAPAQEVDVVERSVQPRAVMAGRFCSTTGMCYNSYHTEGDSIYRFAVSPNATMANYEVAIQLVAPRGTGWIGISWGGSMTNAPLTVAWQNGGTVEVTSRWADGHDMPTTYSGATYKVLSDTNVNSTHWTLSAICTGCTAWTRPTGTKTLSSGSSGIHVAWAQNTEAGAVSQPSNVNSNFRYHHYHNYFDADFSTAKVDQPTWEKAAASIRPAGQAGQAVPPATNPQPVQPAPPQQPVNPWWPWG